METTSIKKSEIIRDWYLIDAENQVLGRLASRVAQLLRGKGKPYYTPHMDMGDFIIIINASKVKVTGNKEINKTYFSHSGYPGSATKINYKKILQTNPEKIINNAVKGMLPHNRLGSKLLTHLKVYKSGAHPHSAQQPETIII